jgi:chemotaxis protein CheD
MGQTTVRMGEWTASARATDVLVALGLGSCIGLALVDRHAAVAGLAHIVLPASGERTGTPGKFADTAVPVLLADVVACGARRTRVEAVLVGGASMFSFGAGALEVGQRNDTAVREALTRLRIPVAASATGGACGRTVRVAVATGRVTARAAGDTELELYAGSARLREVPA